MKKLDFNALSKRELSEREMNSLSGGNVCGCGCVNNSNYDNGTANHAGKKSTCYMQQQIEKVVTYAL